jgi:hypothetical protein
LGGDFSLCVDTDALVNVLALDCFDAVLACLDCPRSRCFRLHALPYQIRKAKWITDRWPLFDRAAMLPLVEQLGRVPASPSVETLQALNIDDIDQEDGYLLAALAQSPDFLLLSGDRRMVEALHRSSDEVVRAVREAARGRVLVFVQIVAALVRRLSLPVVEQKVRSSFCGHRTLKILFGSQGPTHETEFWAAYESEMKSLKAVCGEDWLYPL